MSANHAKLVLALILVFSATALQAQNTATVSGVVTDTTEAVIPGVEVIVVNSATGETLSSTTNEVGAYTIPFIKPGNYTLSAESAGFKRYDRPGMDVDTGAAVNVDIMLELGEVTEVITVEADVPLLRTNSSSVASVIQNKTIANMPLINRRAAQLVRLSGFVVQRGNGSQFAIAGGRGNNAMWTLDGGGTQNILLGVASLTFDPPIEALEEFSVEVSNYKAELGRTGGGFIQMTTKSGTNQFHGALYEFLRNDAMDSRQFFAANKQKLRRNQFGWAIGGPIKKDRTFFFASQEFIKNKSSTPFFENIPDAIETRGDFSQLYNSPTVKNPATGDFAPNNIIPQSELDPVGLAAATFWPTPNVSGRNSRSLNYTGQSFTSAPNNTLSVRVDHSINDHNRLFGRYAQNLQDQEQNGGRWPQPVHANHRLIESSYYNWSVTHIANFTNTIIGEFRYTGSRRKWHPIIAAKGLGLAQQIGIQGVDQDFFPGFGFTGGVQRIGRAGGQERRQFPIIDNHVVSNFTMIKGSHAIKFGGEMRASKNDDVFLSRAGGDFSFNSNGAGDSVAAMLYGWTNRGRREETFSLQSRAATMGFYVQDDWKVNSKLTLNLGIRYDIDTPRWEGFNNRQNSFDRGANNPACDCPGLIVWSGRDARGGSKYAHNFVTANIGPRVGIAYRVDDDWVIRAGGSIVYAGQYDQATPVVTNAGFSINGDFRASNTAGMAFLLRDGLPNIPVPDESSLVPGFGAVGPGQGGIFSPQFFQPEGRPFPRLFTGNLNIQRSLPGDALFEVGYLTTYGKHLTLPGSATQNQIHPSQIHFVDEGVSQQALRPFPQFSNVTMIAPTWGSSMYHGVNFKLEKRYSKGLQFNMNYTFSRALDDVDSRNELGGQGNRVPFTNQYDRRIAWSLTGNHIKHRYITSVVWDIPYGRDRANSFSNPVLNQVAGGWTLGTIIEARTGPPLSAFYGNTGRVYPTAARVRAEITGDYQPNSAWRDNVKGETFYNTGAFGQPARFTFGNVSRNFNIGSGALRTDVSIIKHIYLPWEGQDFQIRAEFINLPNRANFGLPVENVNSGSFGTVNRLTVGASGRIAQIGLRYAF